MLVDCYVELGSFYGGQKISNCIDLSYFDETRGTSFFQHTCGLWSPYAAKSLQWAHLYFHIYILSMILFFLFIVVCPFTSPAAVSINISCFCTEKVTTKCDVVGCHIGQWPSSTNWNRYTIPVDCCVNAFLPLLSSMGSFTAKMVVLRRVCEVPTLRQKMFPCWFYPPSKPK